MRRAREEETEELENSQETITRSVNKHIPINNYFKCKWAKYSNNKTYSG